MCNLFLMNGKPLFLLKMVQYELIRKTERKVTSVYRKGRGRSKALTENQLIEAIETYGTTSPYRLSKFLNVSHMTIYRKLKQIPKEKILEIFKRIGESELKPYQMTFEGFMSIPEMRKFDDLLERRILSRKYKRRILRSIWRICINLKKHPRNLTIEECANFILKAKIKRIRGFSHLKHSIRSWFRLMHGVDSEILTNKGIDGACEYEIGLRARDRLTRKQRHSFLKALIEIVEDDSNEREFMDIWISLVYFLYYTATRIIATLNAHIEDIEKFHNKWVITVIDKGRYKKGRKKWKKLIMGN